MVYPAHAGPWFGCYWSGVVSCVLRGVACGVLLAVHEVLCCS